MGSARVGRGAVPKRGVLACLSRSCVEHRESPEALRGDYPPMRRWPVPNQKIRALLRLQPPDIHHFAKTRDPTLGNGIKMHSGFVAG